MEFEGLFFFIFRRLVVWWILVSIIIIEFDIEYEVFVETAFVDRLYCVIEAGGVGVEGSVYVVQCMGYGIYCINYKYDFGFLFKGYGLKRVGCIVSLSEVVAEFLFLEFTELGVSVVVLGVQVSEVGGKVIDGIGGQFDGDGIFSSFFIVCYYIFQGFLVIIGYLGEVGIEALGGSKEFAGIFGTGEQDGYAGIGFLQQGSYYIFESRTVYGAVYFF